MSYSAPAGSAISFENVRIGFDAAEVLRGVTFHAQPGETKVLLGETGTGKTLLLKMAAGLIRPDAGRVTVLGHDVTAMDEQELLDFRRALGVVFQEGALFDSMTVAENVAFRLVEEGADAEEVEERVHEALRFVEMEHALDKLPGDLSGGMRRRVSIARALITRPKIVLYDSPTAGLDPVTAQTIITLILRLRDAHDVTALLATHRLQDAFALAHYRFDERTGKVGPAHSNGRGHQPPVNFVVLRDGVIGFEGDTEALRNAQDSYLRQFLV
jgi:phospholipid/cholesterol/gamma-HCH transport system ATP-binding protein